MIEIDIPARTLNVAVSAGEFERRRKEQTPVLPSTKSAFLDRYREFVTSGAEGAVMRS